MEKCATGRAHVPKSCTNTGKLSNLAANSAKLYVLMMQQARCRWSRGLPSAGHANNVQRKAHNSWTRETVAALWSRHLSDRAPETWHAALVSVYEGRKGPVRAVPRLVSAP